MLSTGPNYSKLKTNLRLAVNRLKLLEKKKTELAQKARREIADYIANGKIERAKIRVEHIIREDYLVEAMEVIEMYCDLLLARFGLIQQMKTLDDGLAEAVSSLLWATPRLQADVAELKSIADQLSVKYGKPYAQAARENALQTVNEKLVHKLSVQAPPKILVEKYLIEIAKSHNVEYEPDADVMKEDEVPAGILGIDATLIDFNNGEKPPVPGFIAEGGVLPMPIYPAVQPPLQPFNYPSFSSKGNEPPPLPDLPPSGPYLAPGSQPLGFDLPSYDSVVDTKPDVDLKPVPVPRTKFPIDTLPELPSVPNTVLPDMASTTKHDSEDEIDFDDLSKRFEELKKRK